MGRFVEGVGRSRSTLFPERLEDWMDADDPVRVIDLFVDDLELADLGFERVAAARTGRPGYHPAVLPKLFICGYLNRVPSSRRLEREAGRNVEVMGLTGRLVPDHETIADFRRDNGPAIRRTCALFVELGRRAGVLKGDCVAVDGSKFKAVDNRDRNVPKGKIASRLAHLEASVARYIDEMVRIDRQEEGEARTGKVDNPGRRHARVKREIQPLQAMEGRVEEASDGQVSLTDPAARSMATSARRSGLVGCNVQAAVDTETHLIVAHEVTNAGHDRDQLNLMAVAAQVALDHDGTSVVADKGYVSGRQIPACHEAGIVPTVPRPETSGNRKTGLYVKADLACDAEADVYRCPAGEEPTCRHTREEDGLGMRRYWTTACRDCPFKSRCTTARERRVTRWEHEHLVDEMTERIAGREGWMRLRRSTVEHPFGPIKSWMGATHVPTRRLPKVRTEMALQVLAYNMKRMLSILGTRGPMTALST